MAKTPTEIKSLARAHTASAITVLAAIMNKTDAPESARVAAIKELFDRGWGKATQFIASDEDNPLTLIHKIERVIVDPQNRDG